MEIDDSNLEAAHLTIAALRGQIDAYEEAMRSLPGVAIRISKHGEPLFLASTGSAQGILKKFDVCDIDGYLNDKSSTNIDLGFGYRMSFRGLIKTLLEEVDNEKVFDDLEVIVWSSYPDGSIKYLNRAWFDYTGFTPEQLRQHGASQNIHPDDYDSMRESWKHSVASGESMSIEYRRKSASGKYRWFLSQSNPISNHERSHSI